MGYHGLIWESMGSAGKSRWLGHLSTSRSGCEQPIWPSLQVIRIALQLIIVRTNDITLFLICSQQPVSNWVECPVRIFFRWRSDLGQMAYKPGSVPAEAGDDHSSGTPVARRLARPTRMTTRKRACRLPGPPSLFGLAPGGVCHAATVTGGAVRSYRTLSPLPGPKAQAVCSLWHFPWGRPRRPLAGTVFPWSPDFPRHSCECRGHPAIWPGP